MKKNNEKHNEEMENTDIQQEPNESEHGNEIIIENNVELEELRKKSKEYFELAQRTMADFDNYKKRIVKEKELLYADAVVNIISKVIPILDSLEMALKHDDSNNNSVVDGVKMVVKQFKEILSNMGIEEIKAVGQKFDPIYHFAVMHIDDNNFGENEIAEELQKGYIINDRVIRHSMVKVAN